MPLTFGMLACALTLLIGAGLVNTPHAYADTLVVPNYATNSQVPNAAEGVFSAITRHQIVYGASEFPPYPIVITKIQWRP